LPDIPALRDDALGIEADEAAGMAGTKRINYASQSTGEGAAKQLDFWGTLDGTRVVATTAGTTLEPWRVPTREDVAKAFGDAVATKKRRSGPIPLNDKPRYAITAAKYGNRPVLKRRD
jgi:hypothetical protein